MRKVKYLSSMGESEGPGIVAGEIREVADEEAERLVAADLAVLDDGTGTSGSSSADRKEPGEPYTGYDEATADDVIQKVDAGELSLGELLALRDAEARGKKRSTVRAAVEAKLQAAHDAIQPSDPITIPDGVTPGTTPGWPVNEDGEPYDLPDQVREELAAAAVPLETTSKEDDMSEVRGAGSAGGETTDSKTVKSASTTTSKKAASGKKATSKKAASGKKRGS